MLKLKLFGILILGLFLKWIVLKWVIQKMVDVFDWFIRRMLKTNQLDHALWVHYAQKRKGAGHAAPNPLRCEDENCALVHL